MRFYISKQRQTAHKGETSKEAEIRLKIKINKKKILQRSSYLFAYFPVILPIKFDGLTWENLKDPSRKEKCRQFLYESSWSQFAKDWSHISAQLFSKQEGYI